MLDRGKKNHFLVSQHFLKELTTHREFYTSIYGTKEHFDAINDVLIPCVSRPVPESKWMRFPEMNNLIESAYNRVCIDPTRYIFLKLV